MKKVLIVITTQFVPFGGLTTVMMNYYRAMDLSDLQIDFASTNTPSESLIKEINKRGSDYYSLGNRKNVLRYLSNLTRLIRENKYDIVHVNGNSASMAIDLLPALLLGVPKRIAHTHNTRTQHAFIHKMLKPFLKKASNCYLAASKDAGNWLFSDDYRVLNNAIVTSKYSFNEDTRLAIRKEFGIDDEDFVVGNVGKLTPQKNQKYLIDIYVELLKIKRNATLIIAGGGELEQVLKQYCDFLNISDRVKFIGMRTDIERVLQSFDVFVFTSIHEGFGMALLEAQAAGLPCVSSNVVPQETNLTGRVVYLPLDMSTVHWAERIIAADCSDRTKESEYACERIIEGGFDIEHEANVLREIYLV